jgi:hypothetical protein
MFVGIIYANHTGVKVISCQKSLKRPVSFGIITPKLEDMLNIDISGVCYVRGLQSVSPGQKDNQTPVYPLPPEMGLRLLQVPERAPLDP